MLNGCKYCYCCNGIRRATGKNSKNFMQAFQPGRQRVPFPTYPTPPTCPSISSCPYPCPCPLLAHSKRTTVLLSGSIMRGSTRWGRGCWCERRIRERGRERVASMWLAVSGAALVATDQVASYLNVLRARLAK